MEDARRVAEHLRNCERCRTEFDEIQFGAQMAGQLKSKQAPESLWAELEVAINRKSFSNRGGAESADAAQSRFAFSWSPLKVGLASVVTLALAVFTFLYFTRQPKPSLLDNRPAWEVTRLDGRPAIGRQRIDEKGKLPLGEWLTTDEASRAQITIGQIGEVKIEPNSRVQLIEAQEDNHRLAIQRGKMEAFIWAPPRKFFVQTPSALAVDLGCSYTLEVAEDGTGFLHVTMGWVAFEWQGRESFVPAEARCITRPNLGPGTPYFNDATAEFQNDLSRFDTGDFNALDAILASARKRDALTLWHLLARTEGEARGKVFDRLAQLIPPPKPITRQGILVGQQTMFDLWWKELGLGDTEWWRMWKGAMPTTTK